jgi:hypothetical protein
VARVAQAQPPHADEAPHPLSTDWLTAAPLLPGALEAPVCRADDPARRASSAATAEKLARIRALMAAEAAAAPEGTPEVVVLNNRGYNYDSGAVVDPSLIEFEARRLSP